MQPRLNIQVEMPGQDRRTITYRFQNGRYIHDRMQAIPSLWEAAPASVLKDLWTREIAGGPIIDEGQETVQLSDDPRNVFSVGNQETMEGILIIVRMRQTGQEILGLWCTGQLFGQTAKLRCSNPMSRSGSTVGRSFL